jgi:hypothetical protein
VVYRKYADAYSDVLADYAVELGKQFAVVFPSSNAFGFPDIHPYPADRPLPERLIAFNAQSRAERSDRDAVHFFLQDGKFESVWTYPARGLSRIRDSFAVLGPDFSMYSDWPLVVQQFNKFRNHWCMALWQAEGISVIPTVTWSNKASYSWCFEGLPKHSTVAVASVGCGKNPVNKIMFLQGFNAMMEALQPERIVYYGRLFSSLPIEKISYHPTSWVQFKKDGKKN